MKIKITSACLITLMNSLALNGQVVTCTVIDCQVPIKTECFDWCKGWFAINGSRNELQEITRSAQLTDVLITARAKKAGVAEIADLKGIIPDTDIQNYTNLYSTWVQFSANKSNTASLKTGKAEDILLIIKQQQLVNVKESYGERSGQNFSAIDLKTFIDSNYVGKITNELRKDRWFIETVNAFRAISASETSTILNNARLVRRKTWTELNAISREGQTEDGAAAEKMIAEAIVSLVNTMLR